MKDPRIKYYPVGNGDTSLISLSDDTKIIIDINITLDADDEDAQHRYDVRKDILSELKEDDDGKFTDAFLLTHLDNDHCRGFNEVFYTGDPKDFPKDEESELIRIDELWFTPRLFTEYHKDLSEDAKSFKKEAERRIELHKKNKDTKDIAGNRIRIIGYSDSPELKGLEHLVVTPGKATNVFNQSAKNDFSFFIHAPFKDDTDSNEERNDTSVVLQARFDVDNFKRAGLAMFGGDAGCLIWARILELSKDEDLQFDLFLAPHHCSWKFFNTTSHSDNSAALKSSIDILKKKRQGAVVISSSRPFEKYDDDLPPHEKAKKEYIKHVGELLVTSEPKDKPLPIEFRITSKGPQKINGKNSKAASASGLIGVAAGQPKTYG